MSMGRILPSDCSKYVSVIYNCFYEASFSEFKYLSINFNEYIINELKWNFNFNFKF